MIGHFKSPIDCGVRELPDVFDILGQHLSDEELLGVRNLLFSPLVKIYMDYTKTIVIIFTPADRGVWSQHIYKKDGSDSRVKDFAIDASIIFISETPEVMAIMNIVKKEDRHLRLFMGTFRAYGTKRVSTFPNGDMMYLTDRYSYSRYIKENE